MKYDKTFKRKFMNCIHYVSSSIISKNKRFLKESPEKRINNLSNPIWNRIDILYKATG